MPPNLEIVKDLNLIMQDEAKFSSGEAAYVLSHSETVNQKNYLSVKNYLAIIEKQTSPKMRAFLDSKKG